MSPLALSVCTTCGAGYFPPQLLCARCGGPEFTSEPVCEGIIEEVTTVHRAIGRPSKAAGEAGGTGGEAGGTGGEARSPILATVRLPGEQRIIVSLSAPVAPGTSVQLEQERGAVRGTP